MQFLAHRGLFSAAGPGENTAEAVVAALASGADGVEVDVRLTADGIPVCVHDRGLVRVGHRDLRVGHVPWRLLRGVELDGGYRVPTLDEMIDTVDGRGLLVIDVKGDVSPPGDLARAVVGALGRGQAGTDVVVSSLNQDVLTAVGELDPTLRRALITGPRTPMVAAWHRAVAAGYPDLHPHVSALLADHVVAERAASGGMTLRCWTVNRPVDARLLDAIGVPVVITDVAPELRRALATPVLRRLD